MIAWWIATHVTFYGFYRLVMDRLATDARPRYVAVNLAKAFVLMLLSCYTVASRIPRQIVFHDVWDDATAQWFLPVYCCTDAIALLVVPKLPRDTFYHHVCVVLFTLCMAATDFNDVSSQVVWCGRSVFVYGIFSSWGYGVNGYLATRWTRQAQGPWRRAACRAVKYVYALTLLANFCWQARHMAAAWEAGMRLATCVNVALLVPFIRDDFNLLYWMHARAAAAKAERAGKAGSAAAEPTSA